MRVAINGFGRIGKLVFRAFLEKQTKGVEIVASTFFAGADIITFLAPAII